MRPTHSKRCEGRRIQWRIEENNARRVPGGRCTHRVRIAMFVTSEVVPDSHRFSHPGCSDRTTADLKLFIQANFREISALFFWGRILDRVLLSRV